MTSGLNRAATDATGGLYALDRHGDRDARPGLVDFAVNVRGVPPEFVIEAVRARLGDLARYPSHDDESQAVATVASAHARPVEEVLLLAGAADGFEMLPRLRPRHAALIQPSFTEPELVLRAAGIPVTQVVLPAPYQLADAEVPDDADLVVVGNPTNPTSVLHPVSAIAALRRPGRLIVVDEAFADLTLGPDGTREPASLARHRWRDVIVIRSVTKTFGLAGLRAGYLLAAPEVIARLSAGRRPWPLATPALAALVACAGERGERYCAEQARAVESERAQMCDELERAGIGVLAEPRAPFVLVSADDALPLKQRLADHGFAVRSCANFVGLGPDHLRLAVRPIDQVVALTTAITSIRQTQ